MKSLFKSLIKVNPNSNSKITTKCTFKSDASRDKGFLSNLTVYKPTGEPILLSELWEESTVVLKVLPRLGCKFCKYEARTLDDLSFLIDPSQVKIAAVCFTDPDLDTFLSNGYWSWSIFLDPNREVYRQVQLFRVPRWKMIKDLFENRVKLLSRFIDKEFNLPNSIKGDPYQLGGTFIIAPGGKVLFQFRPSKIAMYPSIKEMYAKIGGDPDDIDELTPVVFSESKAKEMYAASEPSSLKSTMSSFSLKPE